MAEEIAQSRLGKAEDALKTYLWEVLDSGTISAKLKELCQEVADAEKEAYSGNQKLIPVTMEPYIQENPKLAVLIHALGQFTDAVEEGMLQLPGWDPKSEEADSLPGEIRITKDLAALVEELRSSSEPSTVMVAYIDAYEESKDGIEKDDPGYGRRLLDAAQVLYAPYIIAANIVGDVVPKAYLEEIARLAKLAK